MSQAGNWDFYRCNVNDRLSFIFTNLSLVESAPVASMPVLNWLWIKLRFPDDRGLSTDQEYESLCDYEDEIQFVLSEVHDVQYVGRITGAGRREFYFYSADGVDLRQLLDNVLANHPEYQFQVGSKPDKDWSQYLSVLYPAKNGLEQIQLRREKLAETK